MHARVGVSRTGDVGGLQPGIAHERPPEWAGRGLRVGHRGCPGRAHARERHDVAVRIRHAAPELIDGLACREQRPNFFDGSVVGLGDDGPRAGTQPAGGKVVQALVGDTDGRLGQAGLAVAGGIAQVIEQHDRIRSQADVLREVELTVVLRRRVVGGGVDWVEPQAVLGVWLPGSVWARPSIPVAHVDDDRGALQRCLDACPGRVGRENGHHVGGVLRRLRRGSPGIGHEIAGLVAHRPGDDHDLGVGRKCRGGGADGRRPEGHERGDAGNDGQGEDPHEPSPDRSNQSGRMN